ncbi:hypothetical protein [Bradyrhizobium cytisi]|uniref:Uncharacterized protein n=1 Tax=Bradyrhizobium cytisi TaxID=515489 RepID=A0A5S4WWD9_9BRAD|nr:hypothetical protein [Bradyrhizobium cytisi]TYL86296.1 hypothetical protein FXB38_07390 [Bradyrhizobium cytisi]
MPAESDFVSIALEAAQHVLSKPLIVRRGAPLLYALGVDNTLTVTANPRAPVRGDSAFETDLCIFEEKADGIEFPRVVLEFKTGVSTHDVLTYSTKARKHKQVYPYLRYGLVASNVAYVPRRFYIHNEALDFFLALESKQDSNLLEPLIADLLRREVATSRRLESIAFGRIRTVLYRNEILVEDDIDGGRH